jgi:hypothetical protein
VNNRPKVIPPPLTICAFTTDPTDAQLFRLIVEPNERNRLRSTCRLMVDNITTVPGPRSARVLGVSMTRTWCGSIKR